MTNSHPGLRLFLLDGSALAYRAHFAMARSNLSAPDGRSVGATFGFATELKRLLDREQPSHAAVVFDTSAPTFRHDLYAEYKATRQRMPEDLAEQLPLLKRAAEHLGVPVLEMDGFEADDLIGTLAKRAEAEGFQVFLVTGDKDFLQLVSDRVKVYSPTQKDDTATILGPAEVVQKFGVPPGQVIDVLGLMGDTSDNVPGVSGIGEKTAAKLIQTYGSIEVLLKSSLMGVSPKIRTALEREAEIAKLSKRLVTIDTAVPVEATIDSLVFAGPKSLEAVDFFRDLGFRTLTQAVEKGLAQDAKRQVQAESKAMELDYRMVRTAEQLDELLTRLTAADLAAVDTETTSLNARHARIVGLSFSTEPGRADYVPLNLEPEILPDRREGEIGSGVLERLKPYLEDPQRKKCGQNLKYDLQVFANHGIALQGILTDSLLGSYLTEPEQRERGIDALALRHFGHTKIKTSEIIGKGKDERNMADVLPEEVLPYAAEDADFALRLSQKFLADLQTGALRELHDRVEIPLIPVLAKMERSGVRVEEETLRGMTLELERETERLQVEIQKEAGIEFNLASPKQLGEVLFEQLKVHTALGIKPKKTKTGYSTDQDTLEALAEHPIPRLILEWRSLTKLLSTYIRVLPDLIDPETGRIHASFHQAVAATGRLSSSDPNLQNIPIRKAVGRRIRKAFVARDADHRLLSADYSQIELRILAHMSRDESLIEAFRAGRDVHAETAAKIFGTDREAVPLELRARAKAVNFGVLYGMGPQRLARENGISLAEAKEFIQRYFDSFPSIREFLDGLKEKARDLGYAETLLGRRRPLPEMTSKNRALQVAAENMAVNTPIQGSAADILKVAMIAIDRALTAEKRTSEMILTVHDELVFDVPKAESEFVEALVRQQMAAAYPLEVPLVVSTGSGPDWLAAHG